MAKENTLFQLFRILNEKYSDEDVEAFVKTILKMDVDQGKKPKESMNDLKEFIQTMSNQIVHKCVDNMNLQSGQVQQDSRPSEDELELILHNVGLEKKDFYKILEVAKIFGCTSQNVQELCRRGKLRFEQPTERGRVIRSEEVLRYLKINNNPKNQ